MLGKNSPTCRRIDFEDANGEECSIQCSSASRHEPLLWLGQNEVVPKVCIIGQGWQPVTVPADTMLCARMHLLRSQVIELIAELQYWVDTGSLKGGTDEQDAVGGA